MTEAPIVLVIDPDAERSAKTAQLLHQAGFTVEIAHHPASSLGRLAGGDARSVAVVIIAAALTGMGATRLARAIRTLFAYTRVPLIIAGPEPLTDGDPAGCLRTRSWERLADAVRRALTPSAASSGRVLVVDDNQVNRSLLTRIIATNGYEVESAEDGLEALNKASRERFALIFMDCEMPRMDGFEATRAIRLVDSKQGSHTPIVACTARSLPGDREAGLAAGMDDYLVKPVPIEAIEAQLTRWLVTASTRASSPSSATRGAVRAPTPPATVSVPVRLPDPSDEPLLDHAVLDRIRGYGGTVLSATTDQFLGELMTRIAELDQLYAAQDFDELSKHAHGLKGSSGSLGARRLWRVLAVIETAARTSDDQALHERMPILPQLAEDCAAAMRAYLAEKP